MDKKIVDTLVKFGLITNIGVDASKYKDINDLIAKGIITIPGAENKIKELLGNYEEPVVEVKEEPVVEVKEESKEIIVEESLEAVEGPIKKNKKK